MIYLVLAEVQLSTELLTRPTLPTEQSDLVQWILETSVGRPVLRRWTVNPSWLRHNL